MAYKSYENEFVKKSFTNHLGQVINPGDDVIMVASGQAQSVDIRKGKFLGMRCDTDNGDEVAATCEYEDRRFVYGKGETFAEQSKNSYFETVQTKTNLWLKRVYKIDTPAWEIRT